jgi:hypothetical protein
MINPEYRQFCTDLTKSFDKDWSRTELKMDFAYKYLEHIPSNAWPEMVRIAVEKWDGWPRNWAKAIKEVYEQWRRDAQFTGGFIKYDKDDDIRFPVNLMQIAFQILDTKGYIVYSTYCDSVGMPKTDRDRVENKHRICKEHEEHKYKLPEIGHRANRKQPRDEIARLKESFTDQIPF